MNNPIIQAQSELGNPGVRNLDIGTTINFSPELAQEDLVEPKSLPVLHETALRGIAGEFVRQATAKTEAHPAAVLFQFLSMYGALLGPGVFVKTGNTKHFVRLFALIYGASSRARKGTSAGPIRDLAACINRLKPLAPLKLSYGPLSSGEGLIYAVRDASEKKDKDGVPEDEGVIDKRLFVLEEEFSSALKATGRDGNILSNVIRNFWDHGNQAPLTKFNRILCSNAHVALVGHLTPHDLSKYLKDEEAWNGFANRFLFVAVHRPQVIACPEGISDQALTAIAERLIKNVEANRDKGEVGFDQDAAKIWEQIYLRVSVDGDGKYDVITARAEAQIIRLALVYAMLDGTDLIGKDHLAAALSAWQYCVDSARFIFGAEADANDDKPLAERVLHALGEGEKSTKDLHKALSGHASGSKLRSSLQYLEVRNAIVRTEIAETGGRPKTIWSLPLTAGRENKAN